MSKIQHVELSSDSTVQPILPIVKDGIIHVLTISEGCAIIASHDGKETKNMFIDLPSELSPSTLTIKTSDKNAFVLIGIGSEGKMLISEVTLEGVLTTGIVDTPIVIIPDNSMFQEPFIIAIDGETTIHSNDYDIIDGKIVPLINSFKLDSSISANVTGVLSLAHPGDDWSIFNLPSKSMSENQGLLFVLYKNKLTRLPIDCVGVVNAIGGLEIIISKNKGERHTSTFLESGILDSIVKGDRKMLKKVCNKDKTLLPDYIGLTSWMKAGDAQISKGIATVKGFHLTNVQGHHPVCRPRFEDTTVVITDEHIVCFDTKK